MKPVGYIYIIHFEPAYKHARHYVGWSQDVKARFIEHRAGNGARLVQVVVKAGHKLLLAVIAKGTRKDERRIKNEAHSSRHCPFCKHKT